ncbi:MAG: bacillithiol biosynthesis cysteine-adding enzyme BshC [Sphingobacteriia bacterium]|nr:bacillithiol biosynthesis cysteine-adding enzyme BshC [Sphingobacteriia bacterium]
MDCTTTFLPYEGTGYFSKITADYLKQADTLRPFYQYTPDLEGIRQSLEARKKTATDRNLLVSALHEQYSGLEISPKVKANIELLAAPNTFTITTAHQPNIFTGPLYFIYKIMHAVKLAEELAESFTGARFVPVYYMGSEDADLDELGFVNVGGQKLVWDTKQTGAVGRMKVDKAFLKIIQNIEGQVAVLPKGAALVELFRLCYTEGKLIQQATLELVNRLFADYGVVVVIPDHAGLKSAFTGTVTRELTRQFSHEAVVQTVQALSQHYKVQAAGRTINLFYLINDKRERIEPEGDHFTVQALQLRFTQEEILQELQQHPERFSPNVILRGVFQETILPNVAFIGGGGELAYWLELKKVFEAAGVPYPVLLLRNSFLFVEKEQQQRLEKLAMRQQDLFTDTTAYINALVKSSTANQLELTNELQEATVFYQKLESLAGAIDNSLTDHVAALKVKALKKLEELEKKMLRAEKDKFETTIRQITAIKAALFPGNNLQERTDNFALFYSKYGTEWMDVIYRSSKGLQQEFGVIYAS